MQNYFNASLRFRDPLCKICALFMVNCADTDGV